MKSAYKLFALKLLVTWCVVGNVSAFAGNPELAEVYNNLTLVKESFADLGVYMPIGSVGYSQREDLRNRFSAANEKLKGAINRLGTEKPEVLREELATLHYEYRWIGMMLPFYAVEKQDQDKVIRNYLAAEDSLARAVRALGLVAGGTISTQAWRHNGMVWVGFGKMSLDRAQDEACSTLCKRIRASENWHVPTLSELAAAWTDIKDPETNTVFGEQAKTWKEVWTSSENATKPGFFDYINFELGKGGSAQKTERYQIICVAKDLS